MPYRTILTLAAIVFAVRYVIDPDASVAGRLIVAVLVIGSFVLPNSIAGQVAAVLAQLGVSLFVIFRLRFLSSGG